MEEEFTCQCGKVIPLQNKTVHLLRCNGAPASHAAQEDQDQVAEKVGADEEEDEEDEAVMRAALAQSHSSGTLDEALWACPTCTLHNSIAVSACVACGSSRAAPVGASAPRDESGWSCPSCTFRNKADNGACDMCGSSRSGEPSSIHEGGVIEEDDGGVRAPDASRRERLVGGGGGRATGGLEDIFNPGSSGPGIFEQAMEEQQEGANAQMNRVLGSALVGGLFGAAQAYGSDRSVMRGALEGASFAAVTTTVFNEFENVGNGMRQERGRELRQPQNRAGRAFHSRSRRRPGGGSSSFHFQFQGGGMEFVEMLRFFMQNSGVEDVDNMDYEELLSRFGNGGTARPANEHDISELPSSEYHSDQAGVEENEKASCSICLSNFCKGDDVSSLPCGHAYHKDCIGQWLRNVNNCPMCKQPI